MIRARVVVGYTAFACASAAGVASGCTSFSSDSTVPETDAGGPADRDGASGSDAFLDANADAEVTTFLTSCNGVDATFCDDFDDDAALTKRWRLNPFGSAIVEITNERARSAPRSLRIVQRDDASVGAELTAEVRKFVERFSMAFDVLFVEAPTGGTFLLESHLTPSAPAAADVVGPWLAAYPVKEGVEIRASNLRSLMGDPGGELIGTVVVGEWAHIALSFGPSTTGMARATFVVGNGMPVTREVPSEGAVSLPYVFFGARSGGSLTNIHYDNIVIDAR